jgi:hypothetical protein
MDSQQELLLKCMLRDDGIVAVFVKSPQRWLVVTAMEKAGTDGVDER